MSEYKVKKIIETDEHPRTSSSLSCGVVSRPGFNMDEESLSLELREKCFQAYEEFSRDMVEVYQRAIDCLKLNKPEPLHADRIDQETIKLIWQQSLNKISDNTKSIVYYIKGLPGFAHLDISDLATLLEEHSMFNLKKNYKSLIQGPKLSCYYF